MPWQKFWIILDKFSGIIIYNLIACKYKGPINTVKTESCNVHSYQLKTAEIQGFLSNL